MSNILDQTEHRQLSGAWNLDQHPLQVLATLNEPQIDKQLYVRTLQNPYIHSNIHDSFKDPEL